MIKINKDRVNLVIGLASLLLAVVSVFFVKEVKDYDLRYFYVQPKSIFDESIFNIDGVQLNWVKGSTDDSGTSLEVHSLENLYHIRFLVWSQGGKFLGKDDFIDEKLFKIKFNSRDVKIISSKTYSSRNGIVLKKEVDENEGVINFFLKDEQEGFEKNDGVVVDVFYTGGSRNNFFIDSRIKGAINGLNAFDLASGYNQKDRISTYIFMSIFTFLTCALTLRFSYVVFIGDSAFEQLERFKLNPFVSKKAFVNALENYVGILFMLAFTLGLTYLSYKLVVGVFSLESRLIPEWIFSFR